MRIFLLVFSLVVFEVRGAPVESNGTQDDPEFAFREDNPNRAQWADFLTIMHDIRKAAAEKEGETVPDDPSSDPSLINTKVFISSLQPGVRIHDTIYLFEGDILLTTNQALQILREIQDSTPEIKDLSKEELLTRIRRKLYTNRNARWPSTEPISYRISKTIEPYGIRNIYKAIDFWTEHTCLYFQEITDPKHGESYMDIYNGRGCHSSIGRVGGRQGISIGATCTKIGIVAHEIGHALGMWHEQARPDAKEHIVLKKQNIIRGMISNFLERKPKEITTLNIPYDLGSVMHYGSTAFTLDWDKPTIETVDPNYQRVIGQRERPSFYDVKAINQAYCGDRCRNYLPCQHGGYPHPSQCSRCLCPDGFTGVHCEKNEEGKKANCGGIIEMNTFDKKEVNISSPGYPDPGYSLDQKCSWLIRVPSGHRIILEFVDRFQFLCTSSCVDYVEVKTEDMANTGARFCCYERPKNAVWSKADKMMVIFRSVASTDVG